MINYITGDATEPIEKPAVILHIVNDVGAWGKGFVLPLGEKYPAARQAYFQNRLSLGENQFVTVTEDRSVVVVNMCAQAGVGRWHGVPPIRYVSLMNCLNEVRDKLGQVYDSNADRYRNGYSGLRGFSIHMPRIGCGLAGGSWDVVGPIVQEILGDFEVYVYDLPVEAPPIRRAPEVQAPLDEELHKLLHGPDDDLPF